MSLGARAVAPTVREHTDRRASAQADLSMIRSLKRSCSDESTQPTLVEYRFRNNKTSNGISIAYNAFDTAQFESISLELLKTVDINSSIFKRFRDDRSVYDIHYCREDEFGKDEMFVLPLRISSTAAL